MRELRLIIIKNELLAFSFIYLSELQKAALIINFPYRLIIDIDLKRIAYPCNKESSQLNPGLSNCL